MGEEKREFEESEHAKSAITERHKSEEKMIDGFNMFDIPFILCL